MLCNFIIAPNQQGTRRWILLFDVNTWIKLTLLTNGSDVCQKFAIKTKHRKNCECCPVFFFIVRQQRLSWIQVLNFQNCKKCLKCHKSLGMSLSFNLSFALCLYLYLYLLLYFCWSGHVPSSLWSIVLKVTSL